MAKAAPRAIEGGINRLRSLALEELRGEWRRLYHAEPPQISRDLSFPKIISARSHDTVHPRRAQQRRYQTVGLLDAVAHPCAVIGACAIHYSRWRTSSEFASGAPRQRSASDPGTRGAQCRSGVPHTCRSRKSRPEGFTQCGRISASFDVMLAILHLLGTFVANLFRSRRRLEVENLFLRHQLNIAMRRVPRRLRLHGSDRVLLVWIMWVWPNLLDLSRVVKPETILRWHR